MPGRDSLNGANRGCLAAALWAGLAGVLTLALGAAAVWFLVARVSDEARAQAAEVAARFERAFNVRPEVRVDGLVVVEGFSPAAEIVTANTTVHARHQWSQTFLYSTKTIEIEAAFTAKAGFSLDEPFRVRVDGATGAVGADLPPPKILSLEMGDPKILRDEDGLWNKLTAADREDAFRELRRKARAELDASDFLAKTKNDAELRLRTLLREPPKP